MKIQKGSHKAFIPLFRVFKERHYAVVERLTEKRERVEELINKNPEEYFKKPTTARIKAAALLKDQMIGDKFSVHVFTEGNKTIIVI